MEGLLSSLSGSLSQHAARSEAKQREQEQLKRKDEDELLQMLERSQDPEKRALAVAARMERATAQLKGKKGKHGAGAGKSILDVYVSGDNSWRSHPAFQQIGQISQSMGAMGAELGNMDERGNAIDPMGAGAKGTPRPGGPPPMAAPGPPDVPSLNASLAQPVGAPADGRGQINPAVVNASAPGGGPPAGPPAGPPGAGGISDVLTSLASQAPAVGMRQAPAGGPPPPPPPPPAPPPSTDPYAATLRAGFQPDVLGNFGPYGERQLQIEQAGQVTEKQQFAEEKRGEREAARSAARASETAERYRKQVDQIELKSANRFALEQFRQGEQNKRSASRKAGGGGSGGVVTPAAAARMEVQARRDFDADMDKLDGERDRLIAGLAKERLISDEDRKTQQKNIEDRITVRRKSVTDRYRDAQEQLMRLRSGGGPPALPSFGDVSSGASGGKISGGPPPGPAPAAASAARSSAATPAAPGGGSPSGGSSLPPNAPVGTRAQLNGKTYIRIQENGRFGWRPAG
jgi:hypothetical protein